MHQGPINMHLSMPSWLTFGRSGSKYSPLLISLSTTSAYFLFYSAYNKTSKSIDFPLLLDVLLCRRGVDWSLKEINKVISLSGLTTLLLTFIPEFDNYCSNTRDLFFLSMNLLWIHSSYSFYKFYGANLRNVMNEKWMKRLSVWLGSVGQVVLALGYFEKLEWQNVAFLATVLGIGHFYTMEIDFKYQLQVRPFAYLPFPLGVVSLYRYFFPK